MSSEETNKLPVSHSSPDIESSSEQKSQSITTASGSTSVTTTTTTTSNLTTQMVKSSTTNGLKFNTTRDSGFSDSIVEDTSSSSLSTLVNKQQPTSPTTRTEHALNVTESNDINLVTKCFVDKGKLKSVEEDIHITPIVETTTTTNSVDDANKEFITIVKTTKVTTKVKHVNNKKNKNKNKRRKSFEKSEEDEAAQAANEDGLTEEGTTQQNQNLSSAQLDENRLITTTTTTTIQSVSTLVTADDDEYALTSPPSLQININKIGEELIYDNSANVPKLDITLLSSSTNETLNKEQVDLNSTVLDCEEILSNYSTNNIVGSPRNAAEENSSVRPLNEVVNAVDVLSDVTMTRINKTDASSPADAAAAKPTTKENKKKAKTEKKAKAEKKNAEPKKDKKRQKFPSCFKGKDDENDDGGGVERTSQKRKNDKSVPVQESPSKLLKSDIHTISSSSSKTPIIFNKYTLLDEPQKDRIIYLKPQCVDLLVNRLEHSESSPASDASENSLG
jgi:hypothetical protein